MALTLATLLLFGCGMTGSQDAAPTGGTNAPVRSVEVSAASLDFGQQPVGSLHSNQTLTVSNMGNARVTVNSISTDKNTFQWQGPALPIRLEPSQSAKVDVLFTPDAETTFSGTLAISSDASASPKRVSLLGRGKNTGAAYTAVSDRRMYAEPALPTLGSAGSQFQDPTFGAWLARVTDGNTRPDRPGKGYGTPGSSEANVWNVNTTRFYVQDAGGNIIAYSFNPANMQTARLGNTGNASGGLIVPLRASPSFSFADPDVLYGFSTSSPLVFSSYHFSTDSVSSLHNPTSCMAGLSGQSGDISVSDNDQRLASALGSWGTIAANTVYVYDQSGGCRWYNTVTGDIGGQWGNPGKVSTAARFLVADAGISRDGEFVRIETTACTTNCEAYYVWDLSTTNLIACSAANPDYCAMPQVLGHYHMVNQGQVDDGMDVLKRPLKSPVNYAHLIQPLPSPTQRSVAMGLSWNNAMNDRLNPVVASTYRTDGAKAQREWENEVIAIRTDGVDSTVWRFCHTRTTVSNSQMAPRGNVSQDGAYFAFTSNWEGTVGSGRTDVFIVELKSSGAPADTMPPVISGVSNSGISATGATIAWTTNEAADTQVVYGTTTSYGSASALNGTLTTSHSMTLAGLQAGTLYHYRVKSRDAAGNLATSNDFTFTTAAPPPPPDTTAPVISAVTSTGTTASGATINWTTNEASDTQGEYGTTTAYGSASALNNTMVTSHSVVLSALQASTLYHYRVKSRDAAGNLATSADFTFNTATPLPPPPSGSPFPVAIYSVPVEQVGTMGTQGINIVANPYWERSSAGAIQFLDTLQQNGKRGIPGFDPARFAARDTAYVQNYVNSIKNHPALFGYYLYDEPTVPAAEAEWAYNTIKAADPNHPIIFIHYTASAPVTYKNAYDIYWDDVYPIGSNTNISIGQWGGLVAQRVAAASPKPFWSVIQTYAIKDNQWVEPTNDELRAMTYLSLVMGGKGIAFYQHCDTWCSYYIRQSPGFWNYTRQIADELQGHGGFLQAATSSRSLNVSTPNVKAMLKEWNGKLYLIAVNVANTSPVVNYHYPGLALDGVRFTISGLGDARAQTIGAAGLGSGSPGRQLNLSGGSFTDNFSPYAVHIYEIVLTP